MSTEDQLTRTYDLWRHAAMAADLGPQNVAADHLLEFNCGYDFQQNGTTAPTLSDVKGDFIDEVVMQLGGREICRLDWYDVCMLQNNWFGQTPNHLLPGANDQYGYFSPVTIPLSLDKSIKNELRSMDVTLTVGALTDVDHLRICADMHYISNRTISWLPNGYHYAYQYVTGTIGAAATPQEVPFPRKGADLLGLYLFSTTIPIVTSLNTTLDHFRIYVNDQPVTAEIHWLECPTFKQTQNPLDDTTYGAELDNYRFFDCSKAPLPADFMDIEVASVGATDTFRLIGIYQEP